MTAKVLEYHFKILSQGTSVSTPRTLEKEYLLTHPCVANRRKENYAWKHFTALSETVSVSFKFLTARNLSGISSCWPWSLMCDGWCYMAMQNPEVTFYQRVQPRLWFSHSRTFLLLASVIERVSTLSQDLVIGLLYGTRRTHIQHQFYDEKRFKLAIITSVRSNEVHSRHHNFHYACKL